MIEKIVLLSMLCSGLIGAGVSILLWFYYRKKIKEITTTDRITELNNFDYIYNAYTDLVINKKIDGYAFITLDIDNFSSYNTLYTPQLGDIILYNCGKQIKQVLEVDEYASRIIGDNFVLLLKKSPNLDKRIEELVENMKDTFNDIDEDMKISLGVYSLSKFDCNYIQSNTYSLLAKGQIKGNPNKIISYFDEKAAKNFFTEQIMLNDLNQSLENKHFVLHYQVKYDIQKNKVIGAEVLVRWNHPILGVLNPMSFIELFERKKCIHKLDLYVVEESCKHLKGLFAEHPAKKKTFRLAINLSGVSFMDTETMDKIEKIVESYEINPNNIEFELTESFFIDTEDRPNVINRINSLRNKRYHIAMDDFGSGYSSLNLLKSIAIDTLKLDKGFLDESTKKSNEIINSIIDMANKLNLTTVAEGIETEEQLQFLIENGCNIGQGYLYSKPIPFEEFEQIYFKEQL